MGKNRFNVSAFVPLLLALVLSSRPGMSQLLWYPGHSITASNGVYAYSANQTPSLLIELYPAAIPNVGLTYQWWSSTNPVTGFQQISGATSSSYQPPMITNSSVTMYYYRVSSSTALAGSVTSNTIKIRVVSVNWEDLNYVREHDVEVVGQTTWTGVDQLPIGSKYQNTTYMDGLGRQIEKVSKQTSTPAAGSNTWGDLVQFFEYDALGREPVKYLPYSTTNQSGLYKSAPLTDQPAYWANAATYNESSAYSAITYDNSPLNRINNVKEPGASWAASAGRSMNYDMNTATDNVQIWGVDYVQGDAPVNGGAYAANLLYKVTSTDVNGNQVVQFVNKSGQPILKKVQAVASPADPYTGWLCTYEVYDDYGKLRFEIQPEGVKYLYANSWSFSGANGPTVLAEQVFQYNYDDKGRMIWKKMPGAAPMTMIYDGRDREVFTQDGNQAAMTTPQWTATLFDALDRPVLSTLYNTSETVANLQSDLANNVTTGSVGTTNPSTPVVNLVVDSRNTAISSYTAQNSVTLTTGFSSVANDAFTVSISSSATNPASTNTTNTYDNPIAPTNLSNSNVCTILNYWFYDDYSFPTARSFDVSFTNTSAYSTSDPNVVPLAPSKRTLTTPTGEMKRVLGSNLFLSTTYYYDEQGRRIQSIDDNIKGGVDISTHQYRFDGRLLSVCNSHTNVSAGYGGFITLDKYIYDNIGRVVSEQKQLGGNPMVTTMSYTYDDMGRVQSRILSPGYSNATTGQPQLESLNYTYNIHNQLTGINRDYALKTSGVYSKWGHYFGLYLGYDNKDNAFAHAQLNGQLTGDMWSTQGDDAQRKYDFSYDNANRLINAAFNQQQHPGEGWSNSSMDFSVSGTSGQITYDNNGNLLTMLQKGVIPGQSAPMTIDDLRYTYNSYSNKVQTVTDMMPTPTLNGLAGDFSDGTNGSNPDYVFDNNGNIVVDLNKNVQSLNNGTGGTPGVHYNFMDKPDQIRIAGKGTVLIVYDAQGQKLQRAFVPDAGGSGTVTTYIGNYTYQETATLTTGSAPPFNGTGVHLAYISFREGRIRAMMATSTNNGFDGMSESGNLVLPAAPGGGYSSGAWDYFVTDNLQNVRMILTEESHSATNVCTMETTNGRPAAEDPVFGQTGSGNEVEATRTNTPMAWSGNTSASVCELGNNFGHTLGPNSLQKVMAGDLVSASVQYYYASNSTSSNPNIVTNLLSSLSSVLGAGPASAGTLVHGQAVNVTNNLNGVTGFTSAVEPDNYTSGTPQAYLTILFFDERFNFIAAADGGVAQAQVRSSDAGNTNALPLTLPNVQAPRNGYVYIYISNRSDQPVYFDNMTINVAAGQIVEEDHYYSFGLKIAGISSHKLGDAGEAVLQNNYQYQGSFSEMDADIGWNDFSLRNYDPQIGRWVQQDPYQEYASPYVGLGDNPVNMIDPSGGDALEGLSLGAKVVVGAILGGIAGGATDESFGGSGVKGILIGVTVGALAPGIGSLTVRTAISMGIHAASTTVDLLKSTSVTLPVGNVGVSGPMMQISQVSYSGANADAPETGANGPWEDLTKAALLNLVVLKFNPIPIQPPYAPTPLQEGRLQNIAGYVFQNTFDEYMKHAPTYIPNSIRLNFFGVEPDGFGSGSQIDIELPEVEFQIDAFNFWYEVKGTNKKYIGPSYAQLGKEIKAMAKVYAEPIKRGRPVFLVVVTTSDVTTSDENKLFYEGERNKVHIIHVVAKYQIDAEGNVWVKFEIYNSSTGTGVDLLSQYPPVKLQPPSGLPNYFKYLVN